MQIKNMSVYTPMGFTSLDKPIKIGIESEPQAPDEKVIVNGMAEELARYNARVVMPYIRNSQNPVDLIAKVDIQTERSGSGWNFLVNFPGFLVFAPAWNGYLYDVKYAITVSLNKPDGKKIMDDFKIPIALDIRHAAINRTWTEISYLEVGAIAFVGGLVFITYDDGVTALLPEKVGSPLGKYVANEIARRINSSGAFAANEAGPPVPRLCFVDPVGQ